MRTRIAAGVLGSAAIVAGAVVLVDPSPGEPATPAPPPTQPVPSAATPNTRTNAPGPGSGPTIHLEARSRTDGSFDVTETIVFRGPQNWLVLAPPRPADGGTAFTAARPRAVQLRLTTEGRPLPASTPEVAGEVDIDLTETVSRVELRYRLTGATVRSTPSATGRALALLAPLTAATDETLRASITIRGTSVRNLVCPQLPASRRLCAADGPQPGVVTDLAAGDAVVVVQLDLPVSS